MADGSRCTSSTRATIPTLAACGPCSIIALFPLVVLLAQPFGGYSYWVPVILIGIGASAHQAWSANLFTTVSDMFPKKAVASVIGIGGMFGGFGGILVNKSGGWLFDAYRWDGIANAWTRARATGLGAYLDQILSLKLVNSHGTPINLNLVELGSLPKDVVGQLQAINPDVLRPAEAAASAARPGAR